MQPLGASAASTLGQDRYPPAARVRGNPTLDLPDLDRPARGRRVDVAAAATHRDRPASGPGVDRTSHVVEDEVSSAASRLHLAVHTADLDTPRIRCHFHGVAGGDAHRELRVARCPAREPFERRRAAPRDVDVVTVALDLQPRRGKHAPIPHLELDDARAAGAHVHRTRPGADHEPTFRRDFQVHRLPSSAGGRKPQRARPSEFSRRIPPTPTLPGTAWFNHPPRAPGIRDASRSLPKPSGVRERHRGVPEAPGRKRRDFERPLVRRAQRGGAAGGSLAGGRRRPRAPRRRGRCRGLRDALSQARRARPRALPAHDAQPQRGRGADAGDLRTGLGTTGLLPGRERLLDLAPPRRGERRGHRAATPWSLAGALHRRRRYGGRRRAARVCVRRRSRPRARDRGSLSPGASRLRAARRRGLQARRDRRADGPGRRNLEGTPAPRAPALTRGALPMSWFRRRRRPPEGPSSPEEQAAVERLLARARALPRRAEPQRDLWTGIRNRIEMPKPAEPARTKLWRARLQVPVWAAGAATVLLVATAIGTGLWLGRAPSLDDPDAVRALADRLRDRDGMSDMRRDLLALLDERRDQLPPEVMAAVEKNLGEIDRAIAEIHLAFQEHPDNSALHFLLAEAYRREAEMLEQLEWWTSARGPEARS